MILKQYTRIFFVNCIHSRGQNNISTSIVSLQTRWEECTKLALSLMQNTISILDN